MAVLIKKRKIAYLFASDQHRKRALITMAFTSLRSFFNKKRGLKRCFHKVKICQTRATKEKFFGLFKERFEEAITLRRQEETRMIMAEINSNFGGSQMTAIPR